MMEIEDLTFDELYEANKCMQCGMCTGGCPVSLRSDLNIRKMMRIIHLGKNEDVKDVPEIWDCTSCGTCTDRCPRNLKPSEVIVGMRSILIEEGDVPVTIRDALEGVYNDNNPWGSVKAKRSDWAEGLNIKEMSQGGEAEYLLYVGCTASYDTRVQEVVKSAVNLLNKLGIDFGILGTVEPCCGSEVKAMGERGLFEMMVEDNIEIFKEYKTKKMVTLSPHAYDTFENEYEGKDFEVYHYTQFLSDLIYDGVLSSDNLNDFEKTVVFHDPCHLGKINKIFEEPRMVLEEIPGIKYLEFGANRERSLCCEGGGGRMWSESVGKGERNAVKRVKEAVRLGADVIAVCCPFCLLTLEDAVKISGFEGEIEVMDIFEILNDCSK